MLSEFLEKKLKKTQCKILKNRMYFGEIPGVKGVWANGKTVEACRRGLRKVLGGWARLS